MWNTVYVEYNICGSQCMWNTIYVEYIIVSCQTYLTFKNKLLKNIRQWYRTRCKTAVLIQRCQISNVNGIGHAARQLCLYRDAKYPTSMV